MATRRSDIHGGETKTWNVPRVTMWVKQELFCKTTGYTTKAITRKRQEGVWIEGVHWKKAPDRNIMINTMEFDIWVDNAT